MADARGQTVSVRLGATARAGRRDAEFAASGTVITFRGFLAAYEEGRDDDDREGDEERPLPHLEARATSCAALELEPKGHATTPPARYTEATLVQALEERGIGRPSTYASIIGTILDRGYVFKNGTALVPSFLAFAVTGLLEQHFDAARRLRLHRADGGRPRPDRRRRRGARRLAAPLLLRRRRRRRRACTRSSATSTRSTRARSTRSPIGEGIVLRVGRYGPYVERGERARERAGGHRARRADGREGAGAARGAGRRPRARACIPSRTARSSRAQRPLRPVRDGGARGGREEKPRAASLFKSMSPETVTLEEALQLLSLPARRSASTRPTARRSRRRTAATART